MSFWTAMVVMLAIICVTELIKSKHRAQRRVDKQRDETEVALPQQDAEARRELQDLRERIKVLERIATDGNSVDARETQRIAREIEALRGSDPLRDRQEN